MEKQIWEHGRDTRLRRNQCSDTKYDGTMKGNHKYSRMIPKAKLSKLKSKLSLSEIMIE